MRSKKIVFLIILCVFIGKKSTKAQVMPLNSIYYQNQYLANPALAGIEKGLYINATYRQSFISGSNANLTNAATAEYQLNKKSGIGASVTTDQDGLINFNRYALSYAYHLPISDKSKLSVGISAGITTELLRNSALVGDANDLLVQQYNDKKPYADADFGIAYTSEKLSIQGAVPNIKSLIDNTAISSYSPTSYFAAISYKLNYDFLKVEPKIAYRALKNYDGVIDAGLNTSMMDNKFNVLALYHSSNNVTFGFGYLYQKQFQLQLAYTSPVNNNLSQYSSGNIELGLRVGLFK